MEFFSYFNLLVSRWKKCAVMVELFIDENDSTNGRPGKVIELYSVDVSTLSIPSLSRSFENHTLTGAKLTFRNDS